MTYSPLLCQVINTVLCLCGVSPLSVSTCFETSTGIIYLGTPTTGVTPVFSSSTYNHHLITDGQGDTFTGRVTPSTDSYSRTHPVVLVSSLPPTTTVVFSCRPGPPLTLCPVTMSSPRSCVTDHSMCQGESTITTSPPPLSTGVWLAYGNFTLPLTDLVTFYTFLCRLNVWDVFLT